jgi:uncharacterized protein
MSFEMGKTIMNYLASIWSSKLSGKPKDITTVSFYGGEPLLNMTFITNMINYITSLNSKREFRYGMTTNAILLDRYADYLADKNVQLTISLDGDEMASGHRVNHNENSSFEIVFRNIKNLKERHPAYFDKSVQFNSVLHNLNDVHSIRVFIFKEFGKYPSISAINPRGLDPKKENEFMNMYKEYSKSIYEAPDIDKLRRDLFYYDPLTRRLAQEIIKLSGNHYEGYLDFISNNKNTNRNYFPCPGTCIPFSRKLFITVNGKILQCERIGQENQLGTVTKTDVKLDYSYVAQFFNNKLNELYGQCSKCAAIDFCNTCVYNTSISEFGNRYCKNFKEKFDYSELKKENRIYLSKHPELYNKIAETLILI